jgi:HAD superfamily hydrolase (TIGR01509 family)
VNKSFLFIFDLDQTLVDSDIALELRAKGKWSEVYSSISDMTLFPHIKEIIEFLQNQNHSIAVVTSSPRKYCAKVLEHFGLEIENIVGYHDTKNKKPHPEPILKAISNAGVDKEYVISFGDNLNDVLASKSAGVKAVGCSWGLKNNKNDFHNLCEFIFDNTLDLKIFLEKEYIGDSRDNEDKDLIHPKDNILDYVGATKDGKRHGQGTYTYANGDKYLGGWQDDKMHGQGTYTWANGNKYVGEWKDDNRHGQGTFTDADGSKYIGDWKDDKGHGQGTYTYADGSKYIGDWKDDLAHGYGTNTWANGNKYVGEWKDDNRHGQGTYTWANGDKYLGGWQDDMRHGQGTFTQMDQMTLEEKWNGEMTTVWVDGANYVGEWKDGKKHGQGTYTYASGMKYWGEWRDDKRHGQGTSTLADGANYVGEWKDGKKHGQGTYTYASGMKYWGEWRDDKRHGQGTSTLADGDMYDGDWKDGKRHGQGTFTWANGDVYVGDWKGGKTNYGQGTFTNVFQKSDPRALKRKPYVSDSDVLKKVLSASNKFPRKDAIPSSHSRYYIPKKHTNGIYDETSKELLSFKDGNKKSIEFWKSIVRQEFENKSYDYVVRVLSSNELTARGRKPLDAIGETIASLTGAIYDKSVLSKSRITEELKYMNKQERIAEISDVYQVSSRLDFSSKRVLIIDDVTTTGTTIKAVAKALKQHTQSIKLHGYCLCKTSDDMNANADFNSLESSSCKVEAVSEGEYLNNKLDLVSFLKQLGEREGFEHFTSSLGLNSFDDGGTVRVTDGGRVTIWIQWEANNETLEAPITVSASLSERMLKLCGDTNFRAMPNGGLEALRICYPLLTKAFVGTHKKTGLATLAV